MTGSSESRDLAVMTIVQDEPEFIHPWVNYYKAHVADPQDIYVLVHQRAAVEAGQPPALDDDPWAAAEPLLQAHHGVNRVPVHHAASFDHDWLLRTVEQFYAFLLRSYSWVLFVEADEFMVPAPHPDGRHTLVDYVRHLGRNGPAAVRANGFEIVHQQSEPPVAPELYRDGRNVRLTVGELVRDRETWYRSEMYSKTLLARVPLSWVHGFHRLAGPAAASAQLPISNALGLVHLHRVDFDLALGRTQRARMKRWSKADLDGGRGWQNRIEDAAKLRTFFATDVDTEQPLAPGRLRPIHPGVKRALG